MMAELGFADPIDPDQPLNEVGLDSLRSVTLANNLEDEFGVLVAISELISGPTINELVDHLLDLFAGIAKAEPGQPRPAMAAPAVITALAAAPPIAPRIARDQFRDGAGLHQVTNGHAPDETALNPVRNDPRAYPDVGVDEKTPPASKRGNGAGAEDFHTPVFLPAGEVASRTTGKWLIAPRPNPDAKARLFCFPYAGGGLGSFRSWGRLFDDSVEVVAVEPPGRGTRINESPVDDLDTFVERLLPELVDWLDRPSAFFGHCLGGLTMYATLCALPEACAQFIKYLFACGVRPPHLLKRRGEFEDNLVYDMMLHKEFDIRVPLYAQTDEIFADLIRQFDTPAADKMLQIPKLRRILLPTIRAEFGMACNYEYQRGEPFSFPISSFVGDLDPWVSQKDSAGWGELTRGGFTNHVRKGSHFLMAEDREYILKTINNEFVNSAIQ